MADRKVICFFVLFLTVYFLESIGGFYMTSAVVAIEKQFQIPSRMSGLMVSAGDFGYIPSVVFVSYLGGKGNRAKWIGGGCLMIAIANLLISMSNFLFPIGNISLETSLIEENLELDPSRLSSSHTVGSFVNFVDNMWPLSDLAKKLDLSKDDYGISAKTWFKNNLKYCSLKNRSIDVCDRYFKYLDAVNTVNLEEISNVRILIGSSFTICNKIINALRSHVEDVKCSVDPSNYGPFFLIFFGLLILGIGRTMPFSLGLPLIDDNVQRKNLPMYFAGMFFIRILGPVLGFMIGSITNKYYYTFNVPQGLSPRDPMWIGRWWAGFLGIGVVLFGPSLALYFFPAKIEKNNDEKEIKLPDDNELEMKPLKGENGKKRSLALVDRHVDRDKEGNVLVPKTFTEKCEDFKKTMKIVLKSPVYVGALVGRVLDVLAFKGFFVFLPKYLEVQFGLPQHKISLYLGVSGVGGFAAGVLVGSLVMRKFKLQGRKAAAWVAVCSTIAATLTFVNAGIGCKSVIGTLGDDPLIVSGQFNNICKMGCNCDGAPLYPVCNIEGKAFYSPCHAGCPLDMNLVENSINKVFNGCLCSNTTDRVVSRDYCDQSDCDVKFMRYFILMAIKGMISGMGVIPAILIILRSVPPIDRSVSLGFQGLFVSLLATLPSPVLWGWIIDKSCVLWNQKCGDPSRGACVIYNTDSLRLQIHITHGVIRLISLLSDFWVFYFAKNLILIDDDPTNNEQSDVKAVTSDGIIDKDRKFSM